MTKTTSRHLLDILAEVPDFRNNRSKRHPLSAILGLAVIAITKINSHNGSDSCLKMRPRCLTLLISSQVRSPRSVSPALSSLLDG